MSISELRNLGYTVAESHPATEEQAATIYVAGFGLETYVLEDDEKTLAALVASHEIRTKHLEEGTEE